ncbi:MAG: hypothetical protein ACP5GH_06725 [Nitrososphaeria archaeon]
MSEMNGARDFQPGRDAGGVMGIIVGLRGGVLVPLLPERLDRWARSSPTSLQAFLCWPNAVGSRSGTKEFRSTLDLQLDISALISDLSAFKSRGFYINGMRFALLPGQAASTSCSPVSVIPEEDTSAAKVFPAPSGELKGPSEPKNPSDGPLSVKLTYLKIEDGETTASRALRGLQRIDAAQGNGGSFIAAPAGMALARNGELSADA